MPHLSSTALSRRRNTLLPAGVTALVCLLTASHALDGGEDAPLSATWNGGTGRDPGVVVTLGGWLDAYAWYFDHDDALDRDRVTRVLPGIITTLGAGTPTQIAAARAQVDGLYDAGGRAFADGVGLGKARLWLAGQAYGHFVFRLAIDAACDTDAEVELQHWYVGLTGIPVLGTLRFGKCSDNDPPWTVGEGNFPDSDGDCRVTQIFEKKNLVGLHATTVWKGDAWAGGYGLSVGPATSPAGGTDRNWDVQAGGWVQRDLPGQGASLKVNLAGAFHDPSPSGHRPEGGTCTALAGLYLGPDLVAFSAAADEVWSGCLSTSLTWGPVFLGGTLQGWHVQAQDHDPIPAAFADWATGVTPGAITWSERSDAGLYGGTAVLSWSITGESQKHGGGIKAPARRLGKGGSGAWELLVRVGAADLLDEATDRRQVVPGDALATWRASAANRREGGIVRTAELGLNWYPVAHLLFGIYAERCAWEYDHGALTGVDGSNGLSGAAQRPQGYVTGLLPEVLVPNTPAAILVWQAQSTVRNRYAVDGLWLRGQARF